ncbi:VWA domain-containing protein [Candidatus Microgenomates bacterium]|nr:VWA domain-containing protein [Candidatus Microgenomates bacterium]
MKRILLSLLLLGIVGSAAFGLSNAFFSDTETSTGNTLAAGSLDLKIDNTCYYNNQACIEGSWDGNPENGACSCTWDSTDLDGHLFFNLTDIKPGDREEDTISLTVEDNDAWACAEILLTKNDDNTCTEPELEDDLTCSDPGVGQGELAQSLEMIFWVDDGDNVLEEDEDIIKEGTAGAALNQQITLADATSNLFEATPGSGLTGGKTYYIGKALCLGDLTTQPLTQDNLGPTSPTTPANSTGGILCDGTELDNSTQTDSVMADISFSAVQHRNNPGFLCGGGTPPPSTTPSPTPQACEQADVMLVLDRSGSISSTELGQLKTAAKDFVDSLGLSTTGIHAGKSSFATTGDLNHHLTDDPTSLKAAIDAMISGGLTNLKEGIDLAKVEMDNPGDGHDRTDGTSPDFMIVITDGHPNRPSPSSTADDVAAASADAARLAGSEIFVVGVGADVNESYLENEIADDPDHYFSVSDYSGLQTILQGLDLCE